MTLDQPRSFAAINNTGQRDLNLTQSVTSAAIITFEGSCDINPRQPWHCSIETLCLSTALS